MIAYVPEIAGVFGQGATVEEARASLADALALVVEANRRAAWETFKNRRVLAREPVSSPRGGEQ